MRALSKRRSIVVILLISSLILLWLTAAPISIAAASQGGAEFYVQAELPDNQIDENVSYFDLRMGPKQEQKLAVTITNEAETPMTIFVEAISASTNQNGIIDYKTPNIQDKTLRIPFSTIAIVEEPEIIVPAKSTKVAIITITMPEDSFDGVILGGLVFTQEAENKEEQSQNTAINNIFSYVVGVKLSETDVEVLPQFEIVKIIPEKVDYRPSFTHSIRNSEAVIVKGMNVKVTVTNPDGSVSAKLSKSNVDMAPNSIMPLAVIPERFPIDEGEYKSDIEIEHNGEIFRYQIRFYVTKDEAKELDDETTSEGAITDDAQNTFIYRIITLLLVIIIIILLAVIFIFKRKKK